MNNEYSRIETVAHTMQLPIFVRLIRLHRRGSKKFFSTLSVLPRGIGITGTILFLGLTVAYGAMLGEQGRAVSNSLAAATGFAIKAVKISGQREISELQILKALAIEPNSSLPFYGARDAKERVTAIPWVESVSIQKLYPDILSVKIKEKSPFALWQNGAVVSIIDENGEPVTDSIDEHYLDLPFLIGAEAPYSAKDILADVEKFPEIKSRIRAYKFVSGRRWDLISFDGMIVHLPETDYLSSLEAIDELNQQAHLFSKDISSIDMRLHDRIVFRLNGNGEGVESLNNTTNTEDNVKKVEL